MWDELTLSDKARMIALAVRSGISDLRTIQEVYNTYAQGGPKPKKRNLLKDIAYKISTNENVFRQGAASPKDIIKALTSKDTTMDDNKYAYIYGTGDRYPEIKESIQGFDYTPYINKYGYKDVKNVYGTINPEGEYHVDPQYKNLLTELAKNNYHFYDNADDMFLDSDPNTIGYRDDVANFIHKLDVDNKGNVITHDSDIYDFNPADYNYASWLPKKIVELEAKAMDKIGTPYVIRQENQPIYFDTSSRAGSGIEKYLDSMSEEEIANATNSILLYPSVITEERNNYSKGGKIHIKPENRGKFTALKERTGHSATWFKENGTPAQKKMATFALNARKWHHKDEGGPLGIDFSQGYLYPAPDSIIINRTPVNLPTVEEPVTPAINYDEIKNRQYYIESKFNNNAVNKHSGAQGAYQIMPVTLKDYTQRTGETGDLNDYNFNEKIRDFYMDRYLNSSWATKNNQSEYNRVAKALAAYNWGPGNLLKYLENQKGAGTDIYNDITWISGLPGETRNYIKWILDGEDIGMRTTNAGYNKARKKLMTNY